MNEALARYRYVVFSIMGLVLLGSVGYGLAHRPPALALTVLPPAPTPLPTPAPTAAPVRCHVVGAVNTPGVYTLPPGAAVQQAVAAAGGPAADADLESVNLAAAVQDQQQIVVPRRPATGRSGESILTSSSDALININTADSEALETLPGIGPALAARIIAYREENGPFGTVDDLLNVKGIGEVTLDKLRPLISAGP
jgi:competence protein ComEA